MSVYETYYDLTNEQIDMILDLGLDFSCPRCGTELSIFDTECGYCETQTPWQNDFSVRNVIQRITNDNDDF